MNANAQKAMASSSIILGVISIVLIFFGLAVPFGAMGVIISLLSRGSEKLADRAKKGFILSLLGLLIGAVVSISSIIITRTGIMDDMLQQVEEYYENSDDAGADEIRNLLEQYYGSDTNSKEAEK